jgi:hypothetical protein
MEKYGEEIKQLLELREFGILSEEEFNDKVKMLKKGDLKQDTPKTEPIRKNNKNKHNESKKDVKDVKLDLKDFKTEINLVKEVKMEEINDIVKTEVLEWVNIIMKSYEYGKKIQEIETDLKDSLILVAIINYSYPKLISFKKAKNNDTETNITLCFAIISNKTNELSKICSESEYGNDYTKTLLFLSKLKKYIEIQDQSDETEEIHKILAKVKENEITLTEVNISEKISERTAKELFQALEKNDHVNTLMLSGSMLNDNSVRPLANMIKINKSITT